MVNTESFYGGAIYALEPNYGNPFLEGAAELTHGYAVDPRTANQLKEVSSKLNTGMLHAEVQGTDPAIMDSIPKDHFKEINRLAKLTGTKMSFHAPMIDPTGITQQGFDQAQHEMAKKELWNAVKRSHDLDPEGNVNVTMHASTTGFPGAEQTIKTDKGIEKKSMMVIDSEGHVGQIKAEERYLETGGRKEALTPEQELGRKMHEIWDRQMGSLSFSATRAAQEIGRTEENIEQFKKEHPELGEGEGSETIGKIYAQTSLKDAYSSVKTLFDQAYKYTEGKDKEKLNEYRDWLSKRDFEKIAKDPEKLGEFQKIVEKGVTTLNSLESPTTHVPIRKFAIEKSAETTAELALKSYKKFGDTAPIISIENHPSQMALLTSGGDLRDVVKKAREKFVEKATKDGMSNSEAKEQSEKLIGATWDVGHINQMRKYGYDKSDIIKETKKIAPYVKHVHLSDNFGYENVELPMGMGNVPIKEVRKELKEKGFKGKEVVESAAWSQHFSEGGKLHQMNPYYNVGGGYFAGYGNINPSYHHRLFGAGFMADLPSELGGEGQLSNRGPSGTPLS